MRRRRALFGMLAMVTCAVAAGVGAWAYQASAHATAATPTAWHVYQPLIACVPNAPTGTYTPTATATPPRPILLVRPFLGETTSGSAVISWVTAGAGASEVRYSLDQGYGIAVPAISEAYDGKYWHSATLTGLPAGTTCHYKVYTSGHDLTPWPRASFTTAPAPTDSVFTFAVLGDSRPAEPGGPPSSGAAELAAELSQHPLDLAVHVGDLVHSGGICSGADSSWNQYIRAYFALYQASLGHTPFYPSLGNHELGGGECGYQAYRSVHHLPHNAPSAHEEQFYSFDWGSAHLVALDTSQAYAAGSAQYLWLVADLRANDRPWTFVFFHKPAYSSGAHGSTAEVQAHLVPVFERYGVDVVFSGHDHDYERTCPIAEGACVAGPGEGVVYYVTGGGGAPLHPAGGAWFTAHTASVYHFVQVEVDGCRVHLAAIDAGGQAFDRTTLDRCARPALAPS